MFFLFKWRKERIDGLSFQYKISNFGDHSLTFSPMYKYIFPVALFVLLLTCGHQKHVTTTNNPQTRWHPPVKPLPDPNINIESRPDYHPSETRENDLTNTTLWVRFDWAKRYMYGKAVISGHPYFYPTSSLKLDARGMQINRVALLLRDATDPAKEPH